MKRSNVTNFRNDLEKAIKDLESKYEIKLKVGSIRYNDTIVNVKIEGAMQTVTATNIVNEQLHSLCIVFNVHPKYLQPENAFIVNDQKEKYNGKYYISEFTSRGRNRIVLKDVNTGKRIKICYQTIFNYIPQENRPGTLVKK